MLRATRLPGALRLVSHNTSTRSCVQLAKNVMGMVPFNPCKTSKCCRHGSCSGGDPGDRSLSSSRYSTRKHVSPVSSDSPMSVVGVVSGTSSCCSAVS